MKDALQDAIHRLGEVRTLSVQRHCVLLTLNRFGACRFHVRELLSEDAHFVDPEVFAMSCVCRLFIERQLFECLLLFVC